MAENTMNFIEESGGRLSPSFSFAEQLRKIGIAHIVLGIISCIVECIALIVWNRSSIYELAIPGLLCGLIMCSAGALAVESSRNQTRCIVVSGLVLSIVSLLASFGTFVLNVCLLILLAILTQGFAYELLINIAMILCTIADFANSCVHIHFTRKLRQKDGS